MSTLCTLWIYEGLDEVYKLAGVMVACEYSRLSLLPAARGVTLLFLKPLAAGSDEMWLYSQASVMRTILFIVKCDKTRKF